MARIIFATLGSSGDVRPVLAVALVARGYGHDVAIATTRGYQPVIEERGVSYLEFGVDEFFINPETRAALLDRKTGFSLWMSLFNLDRIEEMYSVLEHHCAGADIIVSTPFVMVSHLVSEKLNLPLVNFCFSPAAYLSDPEIGRNSDPNALIWVRRLNALRQRLNLPRMAFPQMGRFNSDITIGLFPNCLEDPLRTTIRKIDQVGYPLLRGENSALSPDLSDWVARGPFCLFTFGSYVDQGLETLFAAAVAACKNLNMRCLYVTPFGADRIRHAGCDDQVRVERYLRHDAIMPLSSVVVHHGGTGTLSEALYYQRPTVVIPFGLDQHYNAEQLYKMDLAEFLPAGGVTSEVLEGAIRQAIDGHERRAEKFRGRDFAIGLNAAAGAYQSIARQFLDA